jgi:glycosyltransferase involved in cell wall biosynthesis
MEKTAHWQYLLFPTDTEGMPNSVIEMMSIGVPAIASPVGGIPDIIEHGRNGWLMGDTTQADILDSLNEAVDRADDYSLMAEVARKEICHTFSLENARDTALNNI